MDMKRLMEQAQQMQKKLKKIEEELDETVYEGTTGGSEGVSVKIKGNNETVEISIHEDLLAKELYRCLMENGIDRIPFVISDAAYKNAVDEFRVRSKAGTLPEAMKITRYDLRDTKQEEELFNSEQAVIGLFGSENVEIIDEGDR
jgi:hypothetical protein